MPANFKLHGRRWFRIPAVLLAVAAGWWFAVADRSGAGGMEGRVSHPHAAELRNEDGSWSYTNALIDETSPYLLQHAHNPVDWHPWGEAAFAEAQRRQVPIFLSIGYSTCYWCHVMERQVFENPAIAARMNELFVCIKVDREERPDVDNLYMTATQLLTGSGGWPMSVFLTPPPHADAERGSASEASGKTEASDRGLLPFWAGTYIPPEPMHGRPGFPQVLDALSKAWRDQPAEVTQQAERVAAAVKQQLARADPPGPVGEGIVTSVAAALMQRFDPEHGGFNGSQGPKFPTPVQPALLLAVQEHDPTPGMKRALDLTLAHMARGGMYDQIGGGFHRYSVDERWLVPHFEKMLYDNGQLLELYAEAYRADPHGENAPLYARVMRETAAYLLREMRDDTGAFWSAQDAEVNAQEGGNYVWTLDEVRAALKGTEAEGDTDLALKMYGLDRGPNFTDPHAPGAKPVNVLYLPEPLAALGDADEVAAKREAINAALLKVRDTRDQPSTDDKVLAGWNGLVIAGLAKAGAALGEPWMVDAARQATDSVLTHMSQPDGGLYRTMRGGKASIPAFLEDYAFLIHGLVELQRATPQAATRYLDEAIRLMAYAVDHFAAPQGGYYDTLADQSDLFVRARSSYDGAVPSGSSVMLHNLIDLYQLTGQRAYLDKAVKLLRSLGPTLSQNGVGMAHVVQGALRLEELAPPDALAELRSPATMQAAVPSFIKPGSSITATAEAVPGAGGSNTYRITVNIPEGLHLNANPAGMDGLIPTTLEAENIKLGVTYPKAVDRQYPFAEATLPVYEGRVTLLAEADRPVQRFTLRYQACNESTCFAPAQLTVIVNP